MVVQGKLFLRGTFKKYLYNCKLKLVWNFQETSDVDIPTELVFTI